MDRELRQPAPQTEFDKLSIPTPPLPPELPRSRLADTRYASQYFANPRSRLTPVSRSFPCAYLGASRQTAIAEVWSDRFWQFRDSGTAGPYAIARSIAGGLSFMELPTLPTLKLCDFTHADVRMAIGIDAGTLYSTDLQLPQTWAERVAQHPAHFDGIIYRSRLTDELCTVLWVRPGGRTLDKETTFDVTGPFYDSPDAYAVAAKCGVKLAFV
jgi:hypothetical protein